jgi:outer membrane lipoprotein SlyB
MAAYRCQKKAYAASKLLVSVWMGFISLSEIILVFIQMFIHHSCYYAKLNPLFNYRGIFMKKLTFLIGGIVLSGCASQTNWTPTVDSYNDPNAYRIPQDMAECKQLAQQASGGTTTETLVGAGVGGLVGAAGGAVVGAFTGNPGGAAAIGAAAGGFGGGAQQGFSAEQRYKNAYSNCMSNRGHHVVR